MGLDFYPDPSESADQKWDTYIMSQEDTIGGSIFKGYDSRFLFGYYFEETGGENVFFVISLYQYVLE